MARPRLGDGDNKRLHLMIPDEEMAAIDDWRFANRIGSRSEAVRRLCQIGRSIGPMVTEAVVDIEGAAHDYTSLSETIGAHCFNASEKTEANYNEAIENLNESFFNAYLSVTSMKPIVDALSSGESFEAAKEKARDAAAKATEIKARADQLREAMKNPPREGGSDR